MGALTTATVFLAGTEPATSVPDPFYERAPSWAELAPLLEVVVTVVVAAVGGIWALRKYFEQRSKDRIAREEAERTRREARLKEEESRAALETRRLEQIEREERNRRAERAADLILEFGKPGAPGRDQLIASALSLYSGDITPVLITALGQVEPTTASAIATALVSAGAPAVEPLARANRIASAMRSSEASVDEADRIQNPTQLLKYSRLALAQLLMLHLDREELERLDLTHVDLSGAQFQNAELAHANFHKAILSHCSFADALLTEANFRGAATDGAVFTNASARAADFTEIAGAVNMIRTAARRATFDQARIDHSDLSGGTFAEASFVGTSLRQATLDGALFAGATITDSQWYRASAVQAKMPSVSFADTQLGNTRFLETNLTGSSFTTCKLGGADLQGCNGTRAQFEGCELGGVSFERATLTNAAFVGSKLGGTNFAGAVLAGTVFDSCDLTAFDFEHADLREVTFRGALTFRSKDLVDANDSWTGATFEGEALQLGEALSERERPPGAPLGTVADA